LGNSLGHCRDEHEMLRSLQGMRAVLREGGRLVIESRNWEKLHADRVRFTNFGLQERAGLRCIPLYVWNFGREFHEPLVVEVVFVFEQQGKVRLQTYDIAYQPFHTEQLHSLLEQAGFSNLTTAGRPKQTHIGLWQVLGHSMLNKGRNRVSLWQRPPSIPTMPPPKP
jgi:glycine/sarcosine N-methyltransferase